MSDQSTIVITGASGLLGSELVKYYSARGYVVRALVRNPTHYKNTDRITYLPYDMKASLDDSLFKNVDYLIHTAYIKDDKNVMSTNIDAAKILLKKSRKFHIKKNLFISSMSADEHAPSAYARQKFSVEKLFCSSNDAVIRSGLIIGNGGLAQQIIKFMQTKHIAPLIDNGKQPIQIIGVRDTQKSVVTGIEAFKKNLDRGQAGDNAGLLLRGIEREQIERGQVIAKPGSIQPHTEFEAEVYILKKEEGGRHTPFTKGYKPQFYFRTTDVTGEVELPEGKEMVMPGDTITFKVKLMAPIAMEQGLNFAIREGGRTVGAGVVTKITK